jgi:long-chain fatty acid transport protein
MRSIMVSLPPRGPRSALLSLLCLLSLCAWLAPSHTQASGFAAPAVGPSNVGVANDGPSSIHHNPAGIGYARRLRIVAGGALVVGDLSYQRERRATYQYADSLDFSLPIDPLQVDPDKTGDDVSVKANPIGLVPALFAEVPIGPVGIGLGVYVPYAAKVNWPKNGPQRYQLVEATIGTAYITAGAAYRPIKRFSFGVAASLIVGFANLSKVQDLASVPLMGEALARPPINQSNDFGVDADPGVRELDALSRPFVLKNALGLSGTVKGGVLGEVAKDVWLGASAEWGAPVNMAGKFTLDMNDPFFTQDLASQGIAYKPVVKGDADLRFELPTVIRAGVRYDFGKRYDEGTATSVGLEGSYSMWSAVKSFKVQVDSDDLEQRAPDGEILIPRDMKFYLARRWLDSYGAVLRLNHRATQTLMLWGSLGYETTASPDSTIDAASPDGDRITGAGGLSQAFTEHLSVSLDMVVQSVLRRRVVASDYDLGNGTYQMRLFSFGAYGGYTF